MPFSSILFGLICLVGFASTIDIVLNEKCPETEYNGIITKSNVPQPYTGVRCRTNHTGLVQTYVFHEMVYCIKGQNCTCSNSTSFHANPIFGNGNSIKCDYTAIYMNFYLCGCCQGYVEVNHVCVPIPPVVEIQPKNLDLHPSTTETILLAAPIWPIIVGAVLGMLVLVLVVALLAYCCCCVAAAPVAKQLEEDEEVEKKKEVVIIRMENEYVDVGNGKPKIQSEYDVISSTKLTNVYEKLEEVETADKKSVYNSIVKQSGTDGAKNVYSDGPVGSAVFDSAKPDSAEGIYDKIYDHAKRGDLDPKLGDLDPKRGDAVASTTVYENGAKFDGPAGGGVYKNAGEGLGSDDAYLLPDA